MIITGLITIAAAFVLHFTKIHVDKIKTEGWNRITSYSLGVTFAFPFVRRVFVIMIESLSPELRPYSETLKVILTAAYFLAFLFFGMGTALGWLFQFLRGDAKE